MPDLGFGILNLPLRVAVAGDCSCLRPGVPPKTLLGPRALEAKPPDP